MSVNTEDSLADASVLDSSVSQVDEDDDKRSVLSKPLAQLLANRQWWKVCWVYGDQQKYYRQLYGRKKNLSTLRSGATNPLLASGNGTLRKQSSNTLFPYEQ